MSSKQEKIESVYAVFGPEPFLKTETVSRICQTAMDSGEAEDGPNRVDGSDTDLATVLDEVRTYSLLGGRRMVVVEDADSLIKKHRAALENYCASPADSGTLILVCNSLAANTRLYKAIAKTGKVIKCEPIKGRDLASWICHRAGEKYGKQMDSRTAWTLRENVGNSLGALDAELSKLALYVADRKQITTADIEALVGHHREEDVFGVTDAMASGDTAKAFAQWERVLATDRAAPMRAVGGLAWGIRKLLDLKAQAEAGASVYSLAKQAYTQPEILKRRLIP